jgi:hypothetical protein
VVARQRGDLGVEALEAQVEAQRRGVLEEEGADLAHEVGRGGGDDVDVGGHGGEGDDATREAVAQRRALW